MPIGGTAIEIWCELCKKARYRSNRAFAKGEKPQPQDFVPLDGGHELPMGGPPICFECESIMKPIPAEAPMGSSSTVEQAAVNRPVGVRVPASQPSTGGIETVFAVEGDEMILNQGIIGNQILIVTNKRIIKVSV